MEEGKEGWGGGRYDEAKRASERNERVVDRVALVAMRLLQCVSFIAFVAMR